MVDLLQLAPSELLVSVGRSRSSSPAPQKLAAEFAPIPPVDLQQMVLCCKTTVAAETAPELMAVEYLAAMQKLVKRIAQLRSTQEAAIDSLQALLPQVALEAAAVVTAVDRDRLTLSDLSTSTSITRSLTALAPYLLWCLMQTTHESMQLIEGQFARVAQPDQTWKSGMVRLVLLLELQTEQGKQSIDLVTLQTQVPLLPGHCQLQLESLLGSHPLSVTAFLERLTAQPTTQLLKQFFAGSTATWLIPGQHWQTGEARVKLGVTFEPIATQHPNQTSAAVNAAALPMLRFTQPAWLEQHITLAVEHELLQLLRPNLPQTDISIDPEAVVKQGWAAIEALQNSLALASRTFAQQELSLEGLALRLLWGINRTAYEVMQLTSGISVQLLHPQQTWTTGILRLGFYLIVHLPQQTWYYDLAQRSLTDSISTLEIAADAESIVDSRDHLWCFQPIGLTELEAKVWQQIQAHAPELMLLRTDTEVSAKIPPCHEENEVIWQMGSVRLQARFEFTALSASSRL